MDNADLQEAARNTWLHAVRKARNDYRFFMFQEEPQKEEHRNVTAKSVDTVVLPFEVRPSDRHPREMYLLRAAFEWALQNTNADFVVKADHDTFVCSYHLSSVLAQAPRQRYFL